MPTILPFPSATRTPAPAPEELTGLLGDPELASELFAPALPGETFEAYAARHAAAADILADLVGNLPAPDGGPAALDLRSAA
ncbi:hypothetical protein KGD83_21790 [Nocardiopsis akebiae]|uniref:Uncharacterized protein n=1 Tax=Nocardiopsis akebiae TaxID=2831968 RepID=A0ABX8C0F6_9ACTN|nr:hypothetical protein [Nocardiopsis akebiae]QUX27887.1 hypothetical protein KGD83_21790 [Nocardiopsis akebiae]